MILNDLFCLYQELSNAKPTNKTKVALDKIELKRAGWRYRVLNDFYIFCKEVMQNNLLYPPYHKSITDLLQTYKDCLILCARGTLKSTITTVYYPLWILLKYPDSRILITSAALKNPADWVSLQENLINSNQLLKFLFPDFCPTKPDVYQRAYKWTTPQRKAIWKEESVECGSLDNEIVGSHYNLIIQDDLITNNNSRTLEGLEKVNRWMSQAQALLVDEKEYLSCPRHTITVGSRWHFSDSYSKMLDRDMPKIIQSAYLENGEIACPTIHSKELLDKIRNDGSMSAADFSAQYLMSPISEVDALFHIQDLRFYEDDQIPDVKIVITIDPAGDKNTDSGDYTAMVVSGTDGIGQIWVLDYINERMPFSVAFAKLYELNDEWCPFAIYIEKEGVGQSFIDGLQDYGRYMNKFIPICGIQTRREKKFRIMSKLEPMVRNNRIFLQKSMHELIDQFLKFPMLNHDDLLDALGMAGIIWSQDTTGMIIPDRQLNITDFPFEDHSKERRIHSLWKAREMINRGKI